MVNDCRMATDALKKGDLKLAAGLLKRHKEYVMKNTKDPRA